jgi:glutamyl-tRNA reductase
VSAQPPAGLLAPAALESVLARRMGRPLVLIGIGVPRGVDPALRQVEGVRLFDFDDVQQQIARNTRHRRAELRPAEALIDLELARFESWLDAIRTLPTVRDLRELGDRVVDEVVAENECRWDGALTDADRRRVTMMARAVMRRLLHEPTRRLKDGTVDPAVARELFGL